MFNIDQDNVGQLIIKEQYVNFKVQIFSFLNDQILSFIKP